MQLTIHLIGETGAIENLEKRNSQMERQKKKKKHE